MKSSTKYLKITLNILSVAVITAFCVFLLPKVIVFFMPFVIAGIIAMIANPLVKFLEKKVKIVRKAGTAVVIVSVIALIVFVFYLIIAKLIEELIGFMTVAPELWRGTSVTLHGLNAFFDRLTIGMPSSAKEWVNTAFTNMGDSFGNWLQNIGTPIAENATAIASNVPLIVICIIMSVLASYFFLADREYMVNMFNRFVPGGLRSRWDIVYSSMKNAVGGYFKAQFKIMAVVYVVLIIGLCILRIKYALLVALIIAFLDFLPFFGTGTVMIPWTVIAFMQSNYRLAVGLLITWGVSQLVRQLIQPKLLGDSIGLEPIPTLFLLYIGFRVSGAVGLILAVPIGMIVINLYKAGIFSNFVYSIQILLKDVARLRKFSDEELKAEGIEKQDNDEKWD